MAWFSDKGKGENPLDAFPELEAKEIKLGQDLTAAIRDRRRWQGEWQSNEASLFDTGSDGGATRMSDNLRVDLQNEINSEDAQDTSTNFLGVNLSARNLQLIYSQLISNAPVVMAIPASNERQDEEAAKGAEYVMSTARETDDLGNWIALGVYSSFVYGLGAVKQLFDGTIGNMILDERDNKIKTVGGMKVSCPRIWDLYPDPNATTVSELKWVTERVFVSLENAVAFFGEEHRALLQAYISTTVDTEVDTEGVGSLLYKIRYDQVAIYERWDTGTPENGYKGALTYHLRDGRILKTRDDSPCSFKMYKGSKGKTLKARLPYSFFSYEDVPNSLWCRSPAAACAKAQHVLNAAYMVMLNTAQNMGVPKLIVDKSAIAESGLTNDSIDIITLDTAAGLGGGGQIPFTLQAANTSSDLKILLEKLETFINDRWGVNDAMLGKQQRETQGITMQISIMQGNMIRERMFDKYIDGLIDVYQLNLMYKLKHYSEDQLVYIIGENNRPYVKSLKNADIGDGYSIKIERNLMFALDPITRQEQIFRWQPIFTQAGVDPRYLLKQLRFADMRGLYDEFDLANVRGAWIVNYIKEKGESPKIYKNEDHIGIIAYLKRFIGTSEFLEMDEEHKMLIEQQIDQRAEILGRQFAGAGGGQPQQQQQGEMAPPLPQM